MATVTLKLPVCSQWLKSVAEVEAGAATGHGWLGKFLSKTGGMADLEPGTLLAECDGAVLLSIVLPDGELLRMKQGGAKTWAVELREYARELLALEPAARLGRACRDAAAGHRRGAAQKRKDAAASREDAAKYGGPHGKRAERYEAEAGEALALAQKYDALADSFSAPAPAAAPVDPKAAAVARVRALMAELGVSLADLS